MKKLLTITLLLLVLVAKGQMLVSSATSQQRHSLPFTYIDSVSVNGMKTASTKSPKQLIARSDSAVVLTATPYYNGGTVNAIVTYSWSIVDVTDGSVDLTGTGNNFDASSLPRKEYHVTCVATSLNSIPREYLFGLVVEQPNFTEGEADLVINLTQVNAGTWSNPLGNLTVTGTTNVTFDFQQVSRPNLKIAVKGNFIGTKFEVKGLKGTSETADVRIQNVGGQVTFTSNSSGNIFKITDNNQFITIDGRGDGNEYGFKFVGRTSAGTQSQLIYMIGDFINGVKIFGCDFDQKRGSGASDGGAAVQFAGTNQLNYASTNCNGTIGDAGYYANSYIKFFSNRLMNCWDEGEYWGHTSDTGTYKAYRIELLESLYNYTENTGRDFKQVALTNGSSIVGNYGKNNALENNDTQNSAISWNDGNRGTHYVCKNFFEDVEIFSSMQSGETGNGTYYFYDNFVSQKAVVTTNPNQFIFYNIEDIACNAFFFNNTMIAADVNLNPWGVQHDHPTTIIDLTLQIKGNITSSGGSDDSPYAFVRDVGLPSAPNRAAWVIDNTERRTASISQLKLSSVYRPNDITSPAYGAGFDLSSFNLPGGLTDNDGFSRVVNAGRTAGCYSGKNLFIIP